MDKIFIEKYVEIKKGSVIINGKLDFRSVEEGLSPIAKSIYKHYNIKYSKYFKMDQLCKLGFLVSEILVHQIDQSEYQPQDVAVILANSSSSLSNDKRYQETINDLPSPAVFVYTLANIVIGEICIKNDFKGESTFFIQDQFDTKFMADYVNSLFKSTSIKACLTGWVEVDMDNNYHAFLCWASTKPSEIEFNEGKLTELYSN